MFGFLKKKKQQTEIYAPVDGRVISLEEVGDGIFSEKLVGDGVAVIPESDQIVVPVDGEISFVMETGHAFGVRVPDGPEILVHIGIDTVNEKGEGFQVLVKEHQTVKTGVPAVLVNRETLYKKGYNLATMVLVPEIDSFGSLQFLKKGEVCAGKSAVLAF